MSERNRGGRPPRRDVPGLRGELKNLITARSTIQAFAESVAGQRSGDGAEVTIQRLRQQLGAQRASPPDWELAVFIIESLEPAAGRAARIEEAWLLWKEEQRRVNPVAVELVQANEARRRDAQALAELEAQLARSRAQEEALQAERRRLEQDRRRLARLVSEDDTKDVQIEVLTNQMETVTEDLGRVRSQNTELERERDRAQRALVDERARVGRLVEGYARAVAQAQLALSKVSVSAALAARATQPASSLELAQSEFSGGPRKRSLGLRPATMATSGTRSAARRRLAVYLDTCAGLHGNPPAELAARSGIAEPDVTKYLAAESLPAIDRLTALADACGADASHTRELAQTIIAEERRTGTTDAPISPARPTPAPRPDPAPSARETHLKYRARVEREEAERAGVRAKSLTAGPAALVLRAVKTVAACAVLVVIGWVVVGCDQSSGALIEFASGTQPRIVHNEPVCGPRQCSHSIDIRWTIPGIQDVTTGLRKPGFHTDAKELSRADGLLVLENSRSCEYSGGVTWKMLGAGETVLASGNLVQGGAPASIRSSAIPDGTNTLNFTFKQNSPNCQIDVVLQSPQVD